MLVRRARMTSASEHTVVPAERRRSVTLQFNLPVDPPRREAHAQKDTGLNNRELAGTHAAASPSSAARARDSSSGARQRASSARMSRLTVIVLVFGHYDLGKSRLLVARRRTSCSRLGIELTHGQESQVT
jgi:hypothetical protein